MKIALFSPAWPVTHVQNGIVTYVDIMTRAWRSVGHECVVITPRILDDAGDTAVFEANNKGQGSWIEKMRGSLRGKFSSADTAIRRNMADGINRAIDKAGRGGPIDVLDIEESFGLAAFVTAAPTSVRLHGPHFLGNVDAPSAADERRIAAEATALKRADGVTSPSPGLLKATNEFYKTQFARQAVIANPVDIAQSAKLWRYEDCDPDMILFVGRFDRRKGADVMLEAFSTLAKRHPRLKLVMAGKDTGVETDDGLKLRFVDYVQRFVDKDACERIKFLGPVSPEALGELRKKAFVYVSASRFECCAYAVTETMAAGCPVIATSTFGPREFIGGDSFPIADIGNAEHIAEHIGDLYQNRERTKALGAAGHDAVEAFFAPEKIAAQMFEFYQTIISGPSMDSPQ